MKSLPPLSACLSLLALLLPATLRAEDGPSVEVEPNRCEEGRPVELRVSLRTGRQTPSALLRLAVRLGSSAREHTWGTPQPAVALSPALASEVITLDFVAREDLSRAMVARAPRPDVRARLGPATFLRCRLAAPGEALQTRLSVVPRPDRTQLVVEWKELRLAPSTAGVYAPARTYTWDPDAARLPPTERGGPAPLPGAAPGGVRLNVSLTRWRPWRGETVREVLLDRALAEDLEAHTERAEVSLQILPAPFGRAAAAARAGVEPSAAVRLADDRWVLQAGERWHVVPPEGPLHQGQGRVFPFALELARRGRAGLLWYDHSEHGALAAALREAGFARAPGKALAVEVDAGRLVDFLELLARHGARLDGDGIAFAD
ncbi:MAG: hypothetical protein D6731_24340 [Planctomycetota bacterium]|nr:MAG: hypothetical protein D6731_24340 [Planctomycetota bacterium]